GPRAVPDRPAGERFVERGATGVRGAHGLESVGRPKRTRGPNVITGERRGQLHHRASSHRGRRLHGAMRRKTHHKGTEDTKVHKGKAKKWEEGTNVPLCASLCPLCRCGEMILCFRGTSSSRSGACSFSPGGPSKTC